MEKINVTRARKLFNSGKHIIIVPCKCSPESIFAYHAIPEFIYGSFDQMIAEFSYYNCNAETGRLLNYYLV